MYVGKHIKSILSVLLICGLLVVSVPSRIDAAAPLVISPAIKYAIAAGLVAGGLYAVDKEALNYAINDYWNKASDYVKNMWNNAVIYGTSIGTILLNDPLNRSISNYLNSEYVSGENAIVYGSVDIPSSITYPDNIQVWLEEAEYIVATLSNGSVLLCRDIVHNGYYNVNGVSIPRYTHYFDLIFEGNTLAWGQSHYWHRYVNIVFLSSPSSSWPPPKITDVGATFITLVHQTMISYGEIIQNVSTTNIDFRELGSIIDQIIYYGYVGDAAGFGNATEGRPDIKVPCPPLPAAEWPDSWLDNLLDDMNRTGNPTLDDETFVEECEREWDWYWDDNVAYIYRVPHGDPPKDPDDEPIRIPIPPPPQPEIPFPQPDPIPQPAEPCPYCPPNPYPSPDGQPCPNPYCPNQPNPMPVPVPYSPNVPAEPCPYCPPNPYPLPDGQPCPNPYCPNQPNQQPVPTPPPDIQPFYDDPEINWEPLRRSLYELTEKFPFSLPWDLMRGVQSMEANQWDGKIRVVIDDEFWPNFEIDLTMFDRLASIFRVIMLVIFDLGLIFATRKLMGGDV